MVTVPALEEVGIVLGVVEGIADDGREEHVQVKSLPLCSQGQSELGFWQVAAQPGAVVVVDLAVAVRIDIADTAYSRLTELNTVFLAVLIDFCLCVEHTVGLEAHPRAQRLSYE